MKAQPGRELRVLLVARYRSAAMESKVRWIAQTPGIALHLIRPAVWEDEYGQVKQTASAAPYTTWSVPMIGSSSDPHRALYRTAGFALRQWQPDIIQAEEEPDSLAALQIVLARRLFCPRARLFLHTWQNVDRPKAWYVNAILHTTLRAADAVFCANEGAVALLRQQNYRGLTPCIPAIGVDTELFQPRPAQATPARPATIAYIGRFAPEKGILTLLNAVSQLRQQFSPAALQVRLIGAGPQASELADCVAKLGLQNQVTFVPALPPHKIVEELQQIEMLVLPSLSAPTWQEQLGRVLLEAMACGVPVIGSDSGAIPEVIGDAGLIFPEGNATELAARIEQLLVDPELRQQCAQRGVQRAQEQYSQRVLAAKTVAVYQQVLP